MLNLVMLVYMFFNFSSLDTIIVSPLRINEVPNIIKNAPAPRIKNITLAKVDGYYQ
jgi:hypothetical protein